MYVCIYVSVNIEIVRVNLFPTLKIADSTHFRQQYPRTSSSAMAERSRELGDFKDVGHFEAKF